MRLTDMAWVRLANDVVHDVSASSWIGISLGLWTAHRSAVMVLGAEAARILARDSSWALLAALVAASVQVLTGAVRLGYHYRTVPRAAQPSHGRAALWRHAAFVALFAGALWLSLSALQA